MQSTTICMINQKGGCGKSSTCFHLAGQFAKSGRRILLVDADPQGSLSQGFFGSGLIEGLDSSETLASVFDENIILASARELIVSTPFDNIDIVRTNQNLSRFNMPVPEESGLSQFAIHSVLDGLEDYDIVLIDCPPNLYQCSWNAMLAADFVVIPLPPEDFGTQGLRAVHQAISKAQCLNPRLQLLGHVISRSDRRLVVHRMFEQKLRQLYQDRVFQTIIPEAAAFKVALACRQPVSFYSLRCKATKQVKLLCEEIVRRIPETKQKTNRKVA